MMVNNSTTYRIGAFRRKKKNKHEKENELGKKVSNNVSVCRLFCSFDYSLEFNGITSYSRKE